MKRTALLTLMVTAVFLAVSCGSGEDPREYTAAVSDGDLPADASTGGLPALIDLGSTTCVPCRMMVDELATLDSLTEDELEIRLIDVNASPDEASEYGVRLILTQVFVSETCQELYWYEGFISCDDILARWAELGYSFPPGE